MAAVSQPAAARLDRFGEDNVAPSRPSSAALRASRLQRRVEQLEGELTAVKEKLTEAQKANDVQRQEHKSGAAKATQKTEDWRKRCEGLLLLVQSSLEVGLPA